MRKDRSLVDKVSAPTRAFVLAAALTAGPAAAEPVLPTEVRDVAEKMNQLGSETLGRHAGARGDTTVVVSPYGLGSALHLLLLGATGPAERSLEARLLSPRVEVGGQDRALTTLKEHVLGARRDKVKLTLASAVFLPKSADAAKRSPRFVARARSIFDAPVEVLDFKTAGAIERINAWATESTHGLVPRVLEELDPDARFVLTSAVYFNGAWQTAFDPAHTTKGPFTRVDGSTREAAMMDATMPVDSAELGNLQAVWLPYDGNEVAMLVIAPGRNQGPGAVAQALKGRSLAGLMAEAQGKRRTGQVRVRLPKFHAESNLDVTDSLSSAGLAPALSMTSNYAAINKSKSGRLLVIHRAVLDVTEAGTEAAAASAVTSDRSLAQPPLFSADRPFAFAIVHRPTRAVLFAGYVADPGDSPGHAAAKPVR
jgi:serpin B